MSVKDISKSLNKKFAKTLENRIKLLYGKVTKVNIDNYTMDIESQGYSPFLEVPISVFEYTDDQEETGELKIPVVNTNILFIVFGKTVISVLKYAEIEDYVLNTNNNIYLNNLKDTTEPAIRGQKLYDLMGEFLDLVKTFMNKFENHEHLVMTQGTPTLKVIGSPTMATLITEIENLKAQIDNQKDTSSSEYNTMQSEKIYIDKESD